MKNLFADLAKLPAALPYELVDVLLDNPHVRIERIVSTGQQSPEGFWYDQDRGEWVVVLSGEAQLLLEGEPAPIHLRPGDQLDIPAHVRHRVHWTSPNVPTVWLAVYYGEPREESE